MTVESVQGRAPSPEWWDEAELRFGAHAMPVVVAGSQGAVTGVRFGTAADHAGWLAPVAPGPVQAVASEALSQLEAYAAGRSTSFRLPLRLHGTAFQLGVWEALLRVAYGTTSTYGALAALVGRPGQARAVGAAVGSNPVGIVVPCHRVVGADGSLTGFGGGLDNKVALLEREGVGVFGPDRPTPSSRVRAARTTVGGA